MEFSEVFPRRLKQVREEKKMTQKDFSELIQVKQQSLSGYETGKMNPPLDVVANIAKKCSVSIDWLCGISDNKKADEKYFTNYSDIFAALIKIDYSNRMIVETDIVDVSTGRQESVILMKDKVSQRFLAEWGQVAKLYHDGIIGENLYNLWVNDRLKFYSMPITSPYTPDKSGQK